MATVAEGVVVEDPKVLQESLCWCATLLPTLPLPISRMPLVALESFAMSTCPAIIIRNSPGDSRLLSTPLQKWLVKPSMK